MQYFSFNAFLLGALLFGCLYFINLVYSLICIVWKIKIVEFAIFSPAWFYLYKEKITGTKFILGWLPVSTSIRPLGMNDDLEERQKITKEDLPFAFFNKPKVLQSVFPFVPSIIYTIAFLVAVYFQSNSNLYYEFQNIAGYVMNAIKTMFSNNSEKVQFILSTQEIIYRKNTVILGFALFNIYMFLILPITAIMNWFSNDKIKKSTFQKAIGFCATLFILWLILWKIPSFVFSFFSVYQNLVYGLSFFMGMFAIGLVLFFTTLFLIKNITEKLNY